MKKLVVLAAAMMMVVSASGLALSKDVAVRGKVTAVSGDTVTIEVEKGNPEAIVEGSSVKLQVKSNDGPTKGSDSLQGC